jgi:4-aminobutyrate aminotransferase-like enzyme
MQELHQGGLLAASRENAVYLWKGLRRMAEKNPLIREVRGVGLMIGIELTKPAATVVDACREWGLLVGKAGENVVRLVPPLILEQSHIDTALSVLEEALPS